MRNICLKEQSIAGAKLKRWFITYIGFDHTGFDDQRGPAAHG